MCVCAYRGMEKLPGERGLPREGQSRQFISAEGMTLGEASPTADIQPHGLTVLRLAETRMDHAGHRSPHTS